MRFYRLERIQPTPNARACGTNSKASPSCGAFLFLELLMPVTVDTKLVEIAQCLAATAAQCQESGMPKLAETFGKAASDLLAQSIKNTDTVH